MWRNLKLRVAAAVLAGVLALMVLFVAVLHTPPVRRYALKQAIQILAREGVDFDASEVDYNLLNLTATLGHVTVRSRQGEPGRAPLEWKRTTAMPNTLKVLAVAAVIGLAALLGSVVPSNAASA